MDLPDETRPPTVIAAGTVRSGGGRRTEPSVIRSGDDGVAAALRLYDTHAFEASLTYRGRA